EHHVIESAQLVAFMAIDHPLVPCDQLQWLDLKNYAIGTFNKNFMTHQLVTDRLRELNIENQINFTSSSCDYIIEATRNEEIITILLRPVETFFDSKVFTTKKFEDFIPFNFRLCRPVKDKYNSVEDFVFDNIIEHFYQPLEN